jgi:hypothetical protein
MLSSKSGQHFFGRKEELIKAFGKDFFGTKIETTVSSIEVRDVYGYPTSCYPHNPMFNVQKKLPLFTKSRESKSIFCAGYYLIHFNKGWLKAFCPKLITIERNESRGPFKTKLEMKQAFANVKSN